MNKTLYILCSLALFLASCAVGGGSGAGQTSPATENNQTKASPAPSAPSQTAGGAAGESATAGNKNYAGANPADKTACLKTEVPGRRVDPKQTFAIDFEPFRRSCFVTAHDPEFTDPPLGSQFFIYTDGREAFELPEAFNGTTVGCWAEAVAFQDLNGDALTDIVIAGMCSAKSSPYRENMVYVNTGRDFKTDTDANLKLNDFTKIKDIADFVKRNQAQFFR